MDGHDSLTAARAPGAQVRAWLLDMLPVAPGWKTAGELEAARVEAGIGKRALRTTRERLLADGAIEKGRDGFQGRFRYRRAERAAVAESEAAPGPEAEPAASPEAGGGPAVPEVPKRYAATLHALTVPAMAKDVPEDSAVLHALKALAADCGYTLEKETWQSSYNPKLIILKLHPRSPVSGP